MISKIRTIPLILMIIATMIVALIEIVKTEIKKNIVIVCNSSHSSNKNDNSNNGNDNIITIIDICRYNIDSLPTSKR